MILDLRHPHMVWVLAMRLFFVVVLVAGAAAAFEVHRSSDDARREADMWSTIGEMRMNAGDDPGARDAFTRSIALDPRPHTFVLRSFINWRLMDYRACVEDAAAALARDRGNDAIRQSFRSAINAFLR